VYTIAQIVELLGLSSENQARNRIEAVRDLLAGTLRRGRNNQLLVTESGLDLLRALHALCESGHTLKEAGDLLRYRADQNDVTLLPDKDKTGSNETIDRGWEALIDHLSRQIQALEARVTALERRTAERSGALPWWQR